MGASDPGAFFLTSLRKCELYWYGGTNIGGPMMSLTRISVALTLTLVLSATSMSAALARVGMSADGMLVLCIGHQVVTLPMGPDGTPQDTAHICPDCVMGALADFPPPPPPVAPWGANEIRFAEHPVTTAPGRSVTPSARAPPALVF